MRWVKPRMPSPAMVVALIALVAGAGGIAAAQSGGIPGPDGVVHACYTRTASPALSAPPAGALRVVAAGEACTAAESPLSFPAGAAAGGLPTVYRAQGLTPHHVTSKMRGLAEATVPAGSYMLTGYVDMLGGGPLAADQVVQCEVLGTDGRMVPGSHVAATLPKGELHPEVAIPVTAVIAGSGPGIVTVECKDASASKTASHASYNPNARSAASPSFPPQGDVYNLIEPMELEDINNPGPVLATIPTFPVTVSPR